MTLGDVHRGDDPTVGTLAFLREPLEGVGRVQDFEPGLGERFALLLGQGAGNLVGPRAHQIGRLLEDLGTIVNRQGTPGRKRTLRRGDGPIGLGPRSIGHFGQDRLIGRIDHPQRLAVQGIAPRSIDKHAGRILCRSCRASGRRRCHVWLSALVWSHRSEGHSPGHNRDPPPRAGIVRNLFRSLANRLSIATIPPRLPPFNGPGARVRN